MPGVLEGTVRLEAGVPGQVSLEAAARLLGPEVATWLGGPVAGSPSGMRRFAADLHLRPDDSGLLATFHKAAYVDLGSVQPMGHGLSVEISWQSATLAPLFPVFSGWLTVGPDDLRLDGYYAPPGGAIGLVVDRALLHLAARGTAHWLLRRLLTAGAGSEAPPERDPADSEHSSQPS